jgi:hypothetical protein
VVGVKQTEGSNSHWEIPRKKLKMIAIFNTLGGSSNEAMTDIVRAALGRIETGRAKEIV